MPQKYDIFQDHMFHLRLQTKKPNTIPLLTNVLKFLHVAFLFILNNIKKFYNPADANICFLTLIQTPMISGLNSSGFLLHDKISSTEMVDRILSMLNQYLISHKTLELNKSFKIYLKILSAQHSKLKKVSIKKVPLTIGEPNSTFKALWAIDIPQVCELFKNKCLLLCTVLGLAQHDYILTNNRDKRFIYMQYILSKNKKYVKYGIEYISVEIMKILTCGLLADSNFYPLEETVEKLSKHFNCQYFFFEGAINSSKKLTLRYPEKYDPSLKPIFLYKPFNTNHVIYIRNIQRYFHKNGRTCLECKKFYKTKHFCKRRKSCFVCHRFLKDQNTYSNRSLQKFFCDSELDQNLNEKCSRCNLKILSLDCKKHHKLLCNAAGYFGYKCDKCNKFFYRSGNETSLDIKNKHSCTNKTCKICFKSAEPNHLCQLRSEKYPKYFPKLGFIHFEFLNFEPQLATIFLEAKRFEFRNFFIAQRSLKMENCFSEELVNYNYIDNIQIQIHERSFTKFSKSNDFLVVNNRTEAHTFEGQFIKFLLEKSQGITFIISDEENLVMVSRMAAF